MFVLCPAHTAASLLFQGLSPDGCECAMTAFPDTYTQNFIIEEMVLQRHMHECLIKNQLT